MTNYPFWTITNTGVKLGKTKLCKFLTEQGFGNYTKSTDRTNSCYRCSVSNLFRFSLCCLLTFIRFK
jgi:hypothetical protein